MAQDTTPLVQIVIPTYNRPGLCKEALLSVLVQTYKNLRIAITDNSDNEDTKAMIGPFLELDPRITYEHHPDYQEQDNWNRGMELISPDAVYVNWLMDDDLFFPTKIEEMVSVFQNNEGLALVAGTREPIDIQGNVLEQYRSMNLPVTQDTRYEGIQAGRSIFTGLYNYIGEPTTPLVKKDCLLDGYRLGWTGEEGRYFLSDIPTWLHVLEHGDLYFMKKPLSAFRLHDTQAGKNLRFLIKLQGTWAYLIVHAVATKTYLSREEDIQKTLRLWTHNAGEVLEQAVATHYRGEDYDAFLRIFTDMEACLQDIGRLQTVHIQT